MPAAKSPPDIAAYKFFAPPASAGTVQRTALLERILGGGSARVVFLQGPAGHGKSTALQQLRAASAAQGSTTAWLTLDEADNDLRRFYLHLQTMAASLGAMGEERDQGRRRSDWLVAQLLRVEKPVALFFDDFQHLSHKAVLGFFLELFEHLPDHVRLFMATRSLPDMGLARLVVNQRVLVLQSDHLRFSQAEVAQFFAANRSGEGQGDVSAAEIAAIYRSTEGWPAALQLFRLSLASPSVRAALDDIADYRPRELAEYLADNVLALQAPDTQAFLLRTALLGRLTASLCHAVTGRTDSQELLLSLERAGLFVRSLDTELRWFRYHGLFSSFLAEQLQQQSPEQADAVHRAAAHWHRQRGNHEETVQHALCCRDFTLAANTLESWASQLVADAQLVTLERWVDQLPLAEVVQRPPLLVKAAWALVFLHRRSKLKGLLPELEALAAAGSAQAHIVLSMAAISADDIPRSAHWLRGLELREHESEGFAAFGLGAAANVAAYHSLSAHEFERTRELLSVASAHNERGGAPFSRGYTIGMQGMNLLVQGQLQEALQCFLAGMAPVQMHASKSVASAALVACLIWALYEANRLDEAELLFTRHQDIINESALLDFVALAYLAIVRIHDARGRAGRALVVLDEAEAIAHAHGWPRLVGVLNWERIRRALLAGQPERAASIATLNGMGSAPRHGSVFTEDAEGAALGSIRLAIHGRYLEQAARALAVERNSCNGRSYRHIKLNLLEAQLHVLRGEANVAQRHLKRALQLAAPGGFVRCFLDEGAGVLQLLRESYQALLQAENEGAPQDSERSFIERLLQASGTDLSQSQTSPPVRLVETLTEREHEILVLLANGVANKQMAARLFVSENTIKFHLKNIFAKLGVVSRLQAINVGRKLKLIAS